MTATVTIIAVPAEDPDAFESMYIDERRRSSGGWKEFPLRSERRLCTFLMKATSADLGVFGCEEEIERASKQRLATALLPRTTVLAALPDLAALVETNADATARALCAHGGGTASLARVTKALRSGSWPKNGDPAEETAAFAYWLLEYARKAKERRMGLCWEYRGRVSVDGRAKPAKRAAKPAKRPAKSKKRPA